MSRQLVTIDGNEAASYVAHKCSEVCIIYPITPSSPMGEHADEWSAQGKTNLWGTVPEVVEMQSEAGAAAALHGALQTGSLGATFTASQGLLLMIPTMFKIAGELTPCCFHVSARSIAAQALSIFGDHSDVMATRSTGFAMLSSSSIQEVMDMALVAQAATIEARVPFLHFFDGFRTSHEVSKVELIPEETIRAMIKDEFVIAHRARAMNPDHPVVRGTAQNPDVYFQGRETVNKYYLATPEIVEKAMQKIGELTGRKYNLFDYAGADDAEDVIILMGSGVGPAVETAEYLNSKGGKTGVVNVHLYRPFSIKHFVDALPQTVKRIAVLDRTKEPGAVGEPLYTDVVGALAEAVANGDLDAMPTVVGGRYGLSSKEFTPAMVNGVYENLKADKPKNHFTVGIIDDVTNTSIDYDKSFVIESDNVVRAMFYGLGADGTVGANKNSIKIIGTETDNFAQGYFVYDSKKSGSQTVSHLRFGPDEIKSTYLIQSSNFVACHQFQFLEKTDMLDKIVDGGTFLLNAPYPTDEVWDHLPQKVQDQIIQKKLNFYVIDAYKVAEATGMGTRINTIMQTCFFAISGVLDKDEAIEKIKYAIKKTYGKKGDKIVEMNYAAVDQSLANMHKIEVPEKASSDIEMPPVVSPEAPEFVQKVTAMIMAGHGDELPVSMMPADGTFPTATTKWEKRNVSLHVPIWDPDVCIQCGQCSLACPHACIRVKNVPADALKDAPETFKSAKLRGKGADESRRFVLQVAVEDCTGCTLCVGACPAKNKEKAGLKAINMGDKLPILEQERENLEFCEALPNISREDVDKTSVRGVQFLDPLFEYSGACAGCGETPYVTLLSQLFGDRAIIANATGCSSIYGGNLPTTPYCVDENGRGPTWNNSLFEDCAEFGMGFRVTIDKQNTFAKELLKTLETDIGSELAGELIEATQNTEAEINAQRARVAKLQAALKGIDKPEARSLESVCESLVKRSIWMLGGDGWAYDIGYGGLDHVIASGRNVNLLVMDTEVYSNTGGQASKATPRAAVAKFAAAGKPLGKKDLGLIAMSYGNVYVARIAMGANPKQTIQAFNEAEAYDGPSLIIAYSHCIAHGINLANGPAQQKAAVDSGHWIMFRYNPALEAEGKSPFTLDSKPPKIPLKEYAYNETRYKMLARSKPERAAQLIELAQKDVDRNWEVYQDLAGLE